MSKKKPMPARDRDIVEFGKKILADPHNGMGALAGMSPTEPMLADAEREELAAILACADMNEEKASNCRTTCRPGNAEEYEETARYLRAYATILRQPQVPVRVSEAMVERVARAICVSDGRDPDGHDIMFICGPNNEPLPCWHGYVDLAEAALQASVPPGYALVPVEPTQEMLRAVTPPESEWVGHQSPPPGAIERWRQAHARKAAANWKAMLAAAQEERK